MMFATRSMGRKAMLAVLAFQGAALGLVTRDAHAASWHYTIVDGPGSSNTNSTNNPVGLVGAAVYVDPWGVAPLYSRGLGFDANLWFGLGLYYKGSACDGKDPYTLYPVDTTHYVLPESGASALQDGYNTWLAYADGYGDLFATVAGGPNTGAEIYDAASETLLMSMPSVALQGAGTYNGFVFYQAYVTATCANEIHYQYYIDSTGTWSGDDPSTVIATGGNAFDPSATYFNDALWVFYYDGDTQCLRGKTSSTGVSWEDWSPTFTDECITAYPVPPTSFVDTSVSPNRLYVFYGESGGVGLKDAYLEAGGSSWTVETVDATWNPPDVVLSTNSGPVVAAILNPYVEAFYLTESGQMKHIGRGSSGWGSPVLTDGPGCTITGCTHDLLSAPIAAVQSPQCSTDTGDGPHIFYGDNDNGALREAFAQ